MNQLNETLRAVRTSKEVLLKEMSECFNIHDLMMLDFKIKALEDEEQRLLKQLGD